MDAGAGKTRVVDGVLRWNEFEGGFWSLDLEPEHAGHGDLGPQVVLSDFSPPEGAGDGSHVRMRVRERPELVDFTMAGMRVDVLDASLR